MNPFGLSVEGILEVAASVVVVTGPGQAYNDADTHFCMDSSNTVVPGHFVCVATKIPSVVHAQL